MKLMSEISKSHVIDKEKVKYVNAIQDIYKLVYLNKPILSSEAVCPICSGRAGYTTYIDPKISSEIMWFCSNTICLSAVTSSRPKACLTIAKESRALQWPLFCEMNGIGDMLHDVSFEKVHQDDGKINYLRKFSEKPTGFIFMQGSTGSGKTYCSIALCELFTRKNHSCLFYTYDRLLKEWLDVFKEEKPSRFKDRIFETKLLVIDDFGTSTPSPGFLQFIMELVNVRMQWNDKGTVITTNLVDKKFLEFCGDALSDRINTGQKFVFKEKSRRVKTIL